MNNNLTEIIFILDRSGSMASLVKDTIGGFNSFVEEQKALPGEALLTTILFDHQYEVLHDAVNIRDVKPITEKEYNARGMTALLDALGRTINTVGSRLSLTPEPYRPGKVLVVITTDGQENSSAEFDFTKIKEMVKLQTETYKWQFLFLGANIDSFAVADSMGIGKSFTSNYSANDKGTQSLYTAVNMATTSYRAQGTVAQDWQKDVE